VRAGGAVFSGSKRARVAVRRWLEDVDQELADAGVEALCKMMFNGRTERIVLPRALAAVVFA
jgi:hypothetical protein